MVGYYIGLSNFKNVYRVPVTILNVYPGTRLITTTSFSVATSTQNYLNIKHAHRFTQLQSKVCVQLQGFDDDATCYLVFLLLLCEFFLPPFDSAGTRYLFYYPGGRVDTRQWCRRKF